MAVSGPPRLPVRDGQPPVAPSRPTAPLALEGLGLEGPCLSPVGVGPARVDAGQGRPHGPLAVRRQGLEEEGPTGEVAAQDGRTGGALPLAHVPNGVSPLQLARTGQGPGLDPRTFGQQVQLVGRV